MKPLRLAVIGTGHLGRIHTRLCRTLEGAELAGVVEPVEAARQAIAAEFETTGYAHHREIVDQIDGAIIAAPTQFHYEIALDLIQAGKHVLVEKPITTSVTQADELIAAAAEQQVVLSVGHVERFNPALAAVLPQVRNPKYIEARRTSGFTFRSTDVGVVLDIMIHDIDAVLALADSPLVDVQAMGITLFGPHEDMVQARLEFASGCVANVSASRTSPDVVRQTQIFSEEGYASVDFASRTAKVIRPGEELARRGIDVHALSSDQKQHIREQLFADPSLLPTTDVPIPDANPLLDEQQDFCDAIRTGRLPRVTGEAGRAALWTAQRILQSVARHQWDGTPHGRRGADVLLPAPMPLRKAG